MNFLAHLYLSDSFDEEMVGNLMADFIVGRVDDHFPPTIRKGIVLHREIDAYTDSHPLVREAKHRLFPTYRHYAAVIMDVFYDHFLAIHWQKFHLDSLNQFAAQVYQLLNEKQHLLPASMLPMVEAMQRQNWLVNYATVDGIDRSLTNMARRTKFISHMENATDDLEKDFAFFDANFLAFFPDLVAHIQDFKQSQK